MADANLSRLGIKEAVKTEEAAAAAEPQADEAAAVEAPVDERRIVGTKEVVSPSGAVLVVTNL